MITLRKSLGQHLRPPQQETFDIYYASDVHGSEVCWRKFLGAAAFYGVNALIMGGDLVGKAIVPVRRLDDGTYSANFLGERRSVAGSESLGDLFEAIRYNGLYPWVAEASEIDAAAKNGRARAELFEAVMRGELQRWMTLVAERVQDRPGVDVCVMAGNDDPWSCDSVLEHAAGIIACDGRTVRVGRHEVLSCSYANPTPWDSPRELPEDDLYTLLKGLADQLEDPSSSVFNIHVPPYDSGLDRAALIREDLSVVVRGGQPVEAPVGSTAVRQIIEEYQPLLSLHGHIHESRGAAQIGRTLALNPGSQYNTGRIHGALIKLRDRQVIAHQFTIG